MARAGPTLGRIVGAVLLLAAAPPVSAAPAVELWERWTAHNPASPMSLDHGAWDRFLARRVVPGKDGVNRVSYRRVTDAERAELAAYLRSLASVPVREYRREEQFAFWVNLYNALTVDLVLRHYPLGSIRDIDISPGWFADGPWGRRLVVVDGEAVSLDDIEHRILRPIWRDPRVHYVVSCAAVGCPNLPRRALTAENADRLLEEAARAYVNDPRGVAVDGGRLVASRIYDWYRDDFGGTEAGVFAHLSAYAEPPLARALAALRRIDGYRYDWSLNDTAEDE